MSHFRAADHAMGLELQLEELLEQQKRAIVQGRTDDSDRLQQEIDQLQVELAETSEFVSTDGPEEPPQMHDEEKLAAGG